MYEQGPSFAHKSTAVGDKRRHSTHVPRQDDGVCSRDRRETNTYSNNTTTIGAAAAAPRPAQPTTREMLDGSRTRRQTEGDRDRRRQQGQETHRSIESVRRGRGCPKAPEDIDDEDNNNNNNRDREHQPTQQTPTSGRW